MPWVHPVRPCAWQSVKNQATFINKRQWAQVLHCFLQKMNAPTFLSLIIFAFVAFLPFCGAQSSSRLCRDSDIFLPASSPTILYLITSIEPLEPMLVDEFLPNGSVALIAFSDPIPLDISCPCCIWNLMGVTQKQFFTGWNETSTLYFPLQRSGGIDSSILRYMRMQLWFVVEDAYRRPDSDLGPQYYIFLDVEESLVPKRSDILGFEEKLLDYLPHVAVPFHPCNSLDVTSVNEFEITSVYDTKFTAIHASARKLLLPLDDSIFSLVCHLMLRGSVMQFPVGQMGHSDVPNCEDSDRKNQNSMMHFVSSLISKDLIMPLPFSPRIQEPGPPLRFGLMSSIPGGLRGDFDSGGFYAGFFEDLSVSCPVHCGFYYWLSHPAFDCCLSVSTGRSLPWNAAAYDAHKKYSETAAKWNLPRVFDVAGRLTSDAYQVTDHNYWKPSSLTHPLPTFSLALSHPPVTLSEECKCSSGQVESSNSSEIFSRAHFTFQPDRLHLLHAPGNDSHLLHVHMQLTFSSQSVPETQASEEIEALFGSIEKVTVVSNCDGHETRRTLEDDSWIVTSSTDTKFQSAIAPWFYTPKGDRDEQHWFELTSNISKESLRTLIVKLSIPTTCVDRMTINANAVLALRFLRPSGGSCSCHRLFAESQNVSFFPREESERYSFLGENAPTDLFDDQDQHDSANASNFVCSGPNRHWPWEEQLSTALPKDMYLGSYNMCLLQNVCWINQQLTLFFPPSLEPLQHHGFFDFSSTLAVNLSPLTTMDYTRSFL